MTTGTANFAELLWPGIKSIWGDKYDGHKVFYKEYFTVKKSDKLFEKEQGVTSLPLAQVKDQGAPISYVDPNQGPQKEFLNITYGLGASVTREMYEDDQYDYIMQFPKWLARSMRETEETIAARPLNDGFSGSNGATTADALSILNSAHVNFGQGGGTQSNILQTAADLTQTSLETALIDISNWTDDQGKFIKVEAKRLVVPTALQWQVMKILDTEFEVGTNDNTINPVKGVMPYTVNQYLTDDDAWFIVTDCDNGLCFYDRRKAEIERDNEFDTQNLKFIVTSRFSVGISDWKGLYGTPGA